MILVDTFYPISLARLIDSFSVSISCLYYASLLAFFLRFSSFYSQYDSNFILTMFWSCSSSIWAEESPVTFYSSCASSNSLQGSWLARLNLSSFRLGIGSSSSNSTKGSSANVSFCCGAPSVGAFAVGILATFDFRRLASGCGHSTTTCFPFCLFSAFETRAYLSSDSSDDGLLPLICSPSLLSDSSSESELHSQFCSGQAKRPL